MQSLADASACLCYIILPIQSNQNKLTPQLLYASQTIQLGLYSGFIYGAHTASQQRALTFLAENSHNLPTTKLGWYTYQKNKQNQMVKAGIEKGLVTGLRFAGFMTLFALGEYYSEKYLFKQEKWYNPLVGGLTTGIGASIYYRLGIHSSRDAILVCAIAGGCIGFLQETYAYIYEKSIKDKTLNREKSSCFTM